MLGASANRIIVVLGMHRSGTSAVTRGLKALGVELGGHLLPAAPDNEKGFWEDRDFYDLNVELLYHLGFDWHTLQPIAATAFDREDIVGFRLRAVELIRKKIGSASVFALKDPRTARLLPFWKRVFTHLGFETAFVITVRHPMSVARSLKERNGFEEEKSHYLWLEHVVPTVLGSGGSPRVVVSYDRLMDNPAQQLQRIAAALNLPFDAARSDLMEYTQGFLEERLRHTRFQFEDLTLDRAVPKAVIEVFGLMEKLAVDELPIESLEVDQRFREWAQLLADLSPALSYMTRCEEQLADRDRRIAATDQYVHQRDSEIAELRDRVLVRDERIGGLERTVSQFEVALADRDGRIATIEQSLVQRDSEVGELRDGVLVRDEQIAAANRIVSDRDAQFAMLGLELAKRDGQIASLTQSLAELGSRIATLTQGTGERDAQIANLSKAVADRDVEITNLSQVLVERDKQISSLSGDATNRDGQFGEQNRVITELHGQVANLNQIISERDGQISGLKQSVADLAEETARRGDWALRLESELKESQSQLTAILLSRSWRITLPLREVRWWIQTPRAQSKRYGKAVLRRLRLMYHSLPLSVETKTLHRDWIGKYAPRLLRASGARSALIPAAGVSTPLQPYLLIEDRASRTTAAEVKAVLPTSDSPIVSVILPVCGRIDYTMRCVKSIENHPARVAFEVIVVDEGSADNSGELPLSLSGIRLIKNTDSPGFIRSCNAGAKAAKGEYLLFLKNDTEVAPNWMDRILCALEEYPNRERMKIAAVTMVYNEALVLPYFLRHYSYLDEIHVLYETDTTDESLEILMRAPNVVVEKGHIEGGLDDIEKINLINKAVQRIKADWVYVVDPDEFIFPPNNESPYSFLKRQSCDVVRSGMYQVYRHRDDKDLDPTVPPVPQRVHGDPDLFSTVQESNRASNSVYIKPNVVRPSKTIRFLPGHHQIEGDPQASPDLYVGSHWQMADPSIAIARRMERKARVSERNKAHKMGWQHFDISIEKIKDECDRHLDDPIIPALCSFREATIPCPPSRAPSDNLLRDSLAKLKKTTSRPSRPSRASRDEGNVYKFDPLNHPICFSSPRRTVPFRSWRQHIPFAMLLVDLLKPRAFVELGVHYGDSYCAFCQAVDELRLETLCYGIDTWEGDPHASFYGSDVLGDLATHHDPLYGRFSHLVQSTFDEAVQHFPDGVIDILHIDGYHTYEAVKHDFETWLPKVSSRGVVLLHDINEKRDDFGVWKVWDELKVKYQHFEFLHGHGLGVLAAGEAPPEELRWLLGTDENIAATIRQFFFCLGDRLTDKMTLSAK